MKLAGSLVLGSVLLAPNLQAMEIVQIKVNCTIVKDGDVSPMDEGISTMEDYNLITAKFETEFNNAGGLGSMQTSLAFKGGNIGGFPLIPGKDKVTFSQKGPTSTVLFSKKDWKNELYMVQIEKNKGVLLYTELPSASFKNAGYLKCKVAKKNLM